MPRLLIKREPDAGKTEIALRFIVLLPSILFCLTSSTVWAADVEYRRDVKPILSARCFACHGAVQQKSGLRLDAISLVRKGGKHGPVVIAGKANESPLIEAVLGKDRPRMPPEKEGEALAEKEIDVLRAWINQGAKADDEPIPEDPRKHWAFQLPVRSAIPPMLASGRTINPVDAFVATARDRQKLQANPPAEKSLLLRRVYLDLIGLPPTREQLHAFLADDSPDAYEKVADQLLASPRYGERWGRHWMDVWRYSDPFGLGEEYRYSQRHIWRWRDWIIESLNADKGYDRMVVEMLAGDEIAPVDHDVLRATGYLARNWYKFNRNVWIQDTVDYTAAGFLGLTFRCARCHDHKYDPIAQQDYYRFRAFFEPHDIRIDPVVGQPDTMKDGVARSFDGLPDAPTYLFQRGDERTPDQSHRLAPGIPTVLGGEIAVQPVRFTPHDLAQALQFAAQEARRQARADLAAADTNVTKASAAVRAAQQRLQQIKAGEAAAEDNPPPFLTDNFAAAAPDRWTVVRGQWSWENGRLVCKTPSPFATVRTKANHPSNLMGRVRYRTTGGTLGSVGISYDIAGGSFQGIYTNAIKDSAVRAFHRVKGQDTYPSDGVSRHPIKLQEEVTLDFAVRDNLLNTWINGKLCNVYRLPVARQAGVFSLWAHEATADFLELRLTALPEATPLAERVGEKLASPLDGPVVLTEVDGEKLVKNAAELAAVVERKQAIAQATLSSVECRIAADEAQCLVPIDETRAQALAGIASKAERQLRLLQSADALDRAEQAVVGAQAVTMTNDATKKALADAKQKLAAAKKAHEEAKSLAGKEDSTYTPVVKLNPATSTGRRLALAGWLVDRQNPLTARVAVNHIWMRHFGKPLVATPANFGLNGKTPTHPELLDWLAVELMESGWSMKKLHRLLVTSDTYLLGSQVGDPANLAADPDNRLLWRMNPHRMEAETVRDSLLAVAGTLESKMGGPIIDEKLGQTSRRRSIYFRFNTEYRMQFLDQFDPASPTECYARTESVVPQQALALTNSALALDQARLLAKNLTMADSAAFVSAAFEQVLGRAPTPDELGRCLRFLNEQAELVKEPGKLTSFPPGPDAVTAPSAEPAQRARENLIQVLFNHNDFVTIR